MQKKNSPILMLIMTATLTIFSCRVFEKVLPSQPVITTATIRPSTIPEITLEESKQGIQKALDLIMEAYSKNDINLLADALDLENKPFSRFVKTRFTTEQESFSGGGIDVSYRVESVTPRKYDLYLAHINYEGDASVDWIFRRLEDGRWVLTEPTIEQTGGMEKHETDYFEFRIYPWSEDVNSKVERLMQNARNNVHNALGKVPDDKIEVEIIPTYGLYPFDDPNALAYYQYQGAHDGGGDRMVIYAPNSYLFGWYLNEIGWESELEKVLTHEYTHMTHARSFDYKGRLSDWIVEGIAEYVDGVDRNFELADAIESQSLIPLVDPNPESVYKQDLAHLNLLDTNVSLAYAEAESLVAFIVETKGGYDGFRNFAGAYTDKSGDLDSALRKSLGMSRTDFEKRWLNWVKTSGYLTR